MTFIVKICAIVSVLLLFDASSVWCPMAHAFITDEDQQFQADINEARKRAQDFNRTMERIDRDTQLLESAGSDQAQARVREDQELEKMRKEFVRERDKRPSPELERDRLEVEDEQFRKRIEAEMEANRRSYIRKRDRVRNVLNREAYIDEKREYGL